MPSKACSSVPPTIISLKIFPVTNLHKVATLSNNTVGNTFFGDKCENSHQETKGVGHVTKLS